MSEKIGKFVGKNYKFNITFSDKTMSILNEICETRGLKKSVVVGLALEEYAKLHSEKERKSVDL
jgi:hypothetical protein